MQEVRRKVILIGVFGVGKTSMIRNFVHQKFSDEYLSTIGVKVDKKVIKIEDQEMHLLIWDIAGEIFSDNLYKSYTQGAHGIIAVFDVSREPSYQELVEELKTVKELYPDIPIITVGNKIDLLESADVKERIKTSIYDCDLFASAKTGENIEELFINISKKMLG